MKSKWFYIIAAIVVVAVLAAGGAVYYFNSQGHVATVAGEKITESEYRFFLAVAKENMERTANIADTDEAKKAFWKDKEEAAKNAALDSAKEFKIQLIQAKNSKLALDAKDMENINNTIQSTIDQSGGRAQAEEAIKNTYGITIDEYKEIFKNYILMNKFIVEEQKKMQMSDDELKKTYEQDKNMYDKVTVRHILFSTVDAENKPLSDDKQQEAKKKADEMLTKVKAGEDMKALAQQNSQDPGVKENNGEYTFGINEGYVDEFKQWAFKAKVGDVDIVKTTFGYHVMKLEKRTAFEDVKADINNAAASQKYIEKLEQWKKDPQYNVVKNQKIFNNIKVI